MTSRFFQGNTIVIPRADVIACLLQVKFNHKETLVRFLHLPHMRKAMQSFTVHNDYLSLGIYLIHIVVREYVLRDTDRIWLKTAFSATEARQNIENLLGGSLTTIRSKY